MFNVIFRSFPKLKGFLPTAKINWKIENTNIFCRNDADDVETAQSSHQLTEDKKDVALETELETRTPSSSIIGLTFVKAVIIHFTTSKQPH